jgi:hypothetical protein
MPICKEKWRNFQDSNAKKGSGNAMIYEKCREILLRECELVQNAQSIQEKLRLAVTDREWAGFEDRFNALKAVQNELAVLEDERENLFTEYGRQNVVDAKDAKGRFYAMACLLPENQRNDLTAIYRCLKLEALKLRVANEAFTAYLSGINATLRDFFALAFPDRGGKMYTPRGTHFSHDMRSMILNQRF